MNVCLGRKTVLEHKALLAGISLGRLREELRLFTFVHLCIV